MSKIQKLSRREFVRLAGFSAAGAMLAACGGRATTPEEAAVTLQATSAVPTVITERNVRVAVGAWAEQGMKDLLAKLDFTRQTGINVEVVLRTDTKETELTRLASAVQAGTSPYDVIDFEDELTTSFSQAGYLIGLDDLLPSDFWDDFPQAMIDNHQVWSTHNDELFRVLHNWEMPYWFYRKDWFEEKGVAVPTTWDEVRALGEVFTDEETGVWASVDGLIKGAFLNVYLAWITRQAGGSPFDVGEEYAMALEYIHDLMYKDKVLNPASLQKDYNQQNADYLADRVAFMRQWPFFFDVARNPDNAAWFADDKVQIALPPAGPGGPQNSTYAAGWGFGIVKTSPNLEEAKELFKLLIDKNTAVEAVKTSFWFLSARHSVLEAAGGEGVAGPLKMYSDAGVVALRPHHPSFVEALTIIEDTAAAFLTDQVTLEESLQQAQDQLATL
ncbi:MAG: extracellular solute-binding protein [Chloroflexi bacterium]|nr:extracellular solute-binding protein [Chloroflexota bacterium]MCI0578206.1 extracellular solute-binding protein [Chloroflexota bacterium]MCI0645301.1 extracellular solute-binding protein [Chloroflexota bacterium]MCI0729545.1 extracellular solute-binding protein [Chloroflexota bacterium]